jgi:peptidoglycan-N-acetylglucosamine deacetylase
MLNFRTAGITMIILAVVGFLLMIVNIQLVWLLAAFVAVFVYLMMMGSVKICSGFYIDVFCRGSSTEKTVALTFDDGPDEIQTPRILEILDKHQVKATFFIIGSKAENQESLLRQVVAAGHAIGNHSYSHAFFFDLFGRRKMEQDLQKTEDLILKVTGRKPELFRPPYGVTTPVLAKVVKKMGYRVIGWSVRSLDTVLKDKEKLTERVVERLHPGAVILMHDDREITGMVLDDIIVKIKEDGYRIVELEKLI